jgi:hypothetical protein
MLYIRVLQKNNSTHPDILHSCVTEVHAVTPRQVFVMFYMPVIVCSMALSHAKFFNHIKITRQQMKVENIN